jgi:adenylate kinase
MSRIVLLGAPGAGKGTQALIISSLKAIPHISTGEMMRQAVAVGDELGCSVQGFLDRGELVPDEVMIQVIRERLKAKDCKKGFLLDGFPRTVPQMEQLQALLSETSQPLTLALHLVVPHDVLLERIKGRAAAGSGRSDDSGEVALRRLQVFLEQTAPAIELYKPLPIYREINGLGSVEEVKSRIIKVLH